MKVLGTLAVVAMLGFVLLVFILPAMSTNTKAMYTRIGVQWYEQRRVEAMQGDLLQAARSLHSVVAYRPGKVPDDGHFAYVLDTFRASVIREIIARLRTLSGEDLGDDPKRWIEKFYREKESSTPLAL